MSHSAEQFTRSVNNGAAGVRAEGGLGTITEFVDTSELEKAYQAIEYAHEKRSLPRRRKWAEQKAAQRLLMGVPNPRKRKTPNRAYQTRSGSRCNSGKSKDWLYGKIHSCKRGLAYSYKGVDVEIFKERARFGGLFACGLVWACPVCSGNISRIRAREVQCALDWSAREDITPMMITMTARHGRKDDLISLMDGMIEAKRMFFATYKWKKIKKLVDGMIVVSEITHGSNGWHPHFHILVFMKTTQKEAAKYLSMKQNWLSCLRAFGLDGNGHAYSVDGAEKAAKYISKFGNDEKGSEDWGIAQEMTLSQYKSDGKNYATGRTPWALLSDYTHNDDKQAGALFVEYCRTFYGKQQLQWSRGFKKLVGVDEISDEEVADCDTEFMGDLDRIGITISPNDWFEMLKKTNRIQRLEILETAELTDDDEMVWEKVEELLGRPADRELDKFRQIKDRREVINQEAESKEVGPPVLVGPITWLFPDPKDEFYFACNNSDCPGVHL